jgi:hypothetical protein
MARLSVRASGSCCCERCYPSHSGCKCCPRCSRKCRNRRCSRCTMDCISWSVTFQCSGDPPFRHPESYRNWWRSIQSRSERSSRHSVIRCAACFRSSEDWRVFRRTVQTVGVNSTFAVAKLIDSRLWEEIKSGVVHL